MESQNKEAKETAEWYLFVGFMFVGIAIGLMFNKPGAGLMGGMGLGFIISAVYRSEKNK